MKDKSTPETHKSFREIANAPYPELRFYVLENKLLRESLNDTFLTIEQAANFLLVKKSTLYSWVHQRSIPFRKHGSRLIFSKVDLLIWSRGKRVDPLPELTLFTFRNKSKNESCSFSIEYEDDEGLTSTEEV